MGVPGFYKWLSQRYPLIRRKMSDPSRPVINNLYIDTNGLIYKSFEGFTKCSSREEILRMTYKELHRNIDLLVKLCQPTDLVYIALDGPAPNAKTNQQRKNRYLSISEPGSPFFSTNEVLVGSEFMDGINEDLKKYLSEKKKTDELWGRIRVIYSSSYVPGEGEHKIINFIREGRSGENWDPNKVHVMFSNDADCIFLALQTHEPNFIIMRDIVSLNYSGDVQSFEAKETSKFYTSNSFELLYIQLLREYFKLDFSLSDKTLEKFIDDFILIEFLIGNDFIPKFYSLNICEVRFDELIEIYRDYINNTKSFIVEGDEINIYNFKKFLKLYVNQIRNNYYKKIGEEPPFLVNDIDDDEEEEEEEDENKEKSIQNEDNIKFDDDKFTIECRDYILRKFPNIGDDPDDIKSFIYNLSQITIQTIFWTFHYYKTGIVSWSWEFPYSYVVPILYVAKYMDKVKFDFNLSQPNEPLFHQLLILPPNNRNLMPKPIADLMVRDDLKHMFPETYGLDMEGCNYEYQGIVCIENIDKVLIKREYKKVLDQLSPEELKRNRHEKTFEVTTDGLKELELGMSKTFVSENLCTKKIDCMPTFESLEFSSELRVVPVQIFKYLFNKPSIVIKPKSVFPNTVEECKEYIGKDVMVGYPYLVRARVIAVYDIESYVDENKIVTDNTNDFDPESMEQFLLRTKALETDVNCMLVVRPLVFVSTDGISMDYDNTTHNVSASTVVTIEYATNKLNYTFDRFNQREIQPPSVGKSVYIYNGLYKGFFGEIKSIDGSKVTILTNPKPIPQIKKIVNNDSYEWIPIINFARSLKMPINFILKLLSSIYIDNLNVSFPFLSSFRNSVIDGAAKIEYNNGKKDTFISSKYEKLIPDYVKKLGEIRNMMDKPQPKKYQLSFTKKELFPENTEARYNELIDWLTENSPATRLSLINQDVKSLSITTVELIEKELDNFEKAKHIEYHETIENIDIGDVIYESGPRDIVMNNFVPGVRVMSVAASDIVPFGSFGTLISYDKKMEIVDVIFDEKVKNGVSLDGKLKQPRGMRLSSFDIITLN